MRRPEVGHVGQCTTGTYTITTHTCTTRAHATLLLSLTPLLYNDFGIPPPPNNKNKQKASHEEGLCAALAGVSSEHVDGLVREEGGGVLAHVDLLV